MIVFKSHLLFGVIKKLISTAFKTVYKILGVFNLQVSLLVLVLGIILWITGVFASVPAVLTAFWITLALSFVLAGFLTVSKIKKWGGKIFKKKKDERLAHADVSNVPDRLNGAQATAQPIVVDAQPIAPAPQVQPVYPQQNYGFETKQETEIKFQPKEIYPKYFRVAKNPKYYFAEYADRYELFYDNGYSPVKVRTDYKI